jgi:hypothetical protein
MARDEAVLVGLTTEVDSVSVLSRSLPLASIDIASSTGIAASESRCGSKDMVVRAASGSSA